MGAMVDANHTANVMRFIEAGRKTARLVVGGEQVTVNGRGSFVQPTIFDDVSPNNPLARDEIFGPVLSVITFDDEEELGVPLHVLPPRRPQFNGCVERANRSARAEFWSLYNGPLTVTAVAPRLNDYEFFYNYQRPHASLAYRTPNEYLVQMEAA